MDSRRDRVDDSGAIFLDDEQLWQDFRLAGLKSLSILLRPNRIFAHQLAIILILEQFTVRLRDLTPTEQFADVLPACDARIVRPSDHNSRFLLQINLSEALRVPFVDGGTVVFPQIREVNGIRTQNALDAGTDVLRDRQFRVSLVKSVRREPKCDARRHISP